MQGLLESAGGGQKTGSPQQDDAMVMADDVGDPALAKALKFVGQQLYRKGMDEKIATAFDDSPVAAPKNIAMIAYRLAQKADEKTGAEIEEENLAILGMMTLNEVIEIAQAAGMQMDDTLPSKAMEQMVLIFAEDNGLPADQMREAFSQADDMSIAQAAQEAPDDLDEQMTDDDNPVGENIDAGIGRQTA